MRENRPYGSEGGEAELNRPSLPLSLLAARRPGVVRASRLPSGPGSRVAGRPKRVMTFPWVGVDDDCAGNWSPAAGPSPRNADVIPDGDMVRLGDALAFPEK
jgi:hypothetical protein